jgi:hypothetical protein
MDPSRWGLKLCRRLNRLLNEVLPSEWCNNLRTDRHKCSSLFLDNQTMPHLSPKLAADWHPGGLREAPGFIREAPAEAAELSHVSRSLSGNTFRRPPRIPHLRLGGIVLRRG